ncbi:FAD-linked oxidase C-terminal domain-containing protein [Demequina sp. SO4-13]|uniref:FAD-binding and (Fe-S)-binding domain-containing protein n=1 Tax=Demequina sp. SO4-13 TaxID=3401027 RepID=UPI003AF45DB5
MTAPAPETTDLAAHLRAHIDGEVDDNTRRRAEYSSDASNYRVPPAVVVFPRDGDDLAATLEAARTADAQVTMRGGGTSVAGNAIGPGVVIDVSRHLNKILEVDAEGGSARVQPGVVLSELQKVAAPHGLRFGPDPSTTNRATLGGMIGNNACGPHAVAHGKTAQNVLGLQAITGDGRVLAAGPRTADAVAGLSDLVRANMALIRTEFGRFDRQVSGYSLEHLLTENGADLAKFLVGTEGTLATTVEATVRLVPIAPVRLTAALGYADMPAAADAVVPIMKHGPHAVEGLDARLVDRIRLAKGAQAIPDLPPGGGWLFIEVGADTEAEARSILAGLLADCGTDSVRVLEDPREAARLWAIRADGAGLAGRSADNKECWPGWEDAAVPPEHLGTYLREFDSLMASHGVTGQPFGHFGDGCIHVRLDIPLQHDGRPLRAFMEDAAALVASHGGSLSGEHGDGRARGELLKAMYSPEAIALFGQVKALFDPRGHLNPGIIVDPAPLDQDLRRPAAPRTKPSSGGLAFAHDHGDLTEAVHRCTGVGKCRADAIGSGSGFMCPSYAATGDEKDVTRGRARVLQDAINGTLVGGLTAPEVRESLDLCLSCKACSSDCPSGVDMAAYKAEVLHRSYKNKVRPMTHYSIGWLPRWLKVVGVAPRLVNALLRPAWIQKFAVGAAGMDTRRRLPVFAATPFRRTEVAKSHRPVGPGASAAGAGYKAAPDIDSVAGLSAQVSGGRGSAGSGIGGASGAQSASELVGYTAAQDGGSGVGSGAPGSASPAERGSARSGEPQAGQSSSAAGDKVALDGGSGTQSSAHRSVGQESPRADAGRGIEPGAEGSASSATDVPTPAAGTEAEVLSAVRPGSPAFDAAQLDDTAQTDGSASAEAGKAPTRQRVVLWADSFTDGLDPEVPTAIIRVLEAAGLDVIVPREQACCGVTWISTGQLDGARRRMSDLLKVLGPFAINGIPIIGVEPSCIATLRSDLLELLPDDPRAVAVASHTFTLAEVLTGQAPVKPKDGWKAPSLADVSAVVQPHCHQYSVVGFGADRELMRDLGATVTEASGCCGLAGNWGTEKGHYDVSVKVAENSLLPALRDAPEDSIFLADGVSCRTQADDLAGIRGRHLAQLLAERL